MFIKFQRVAAAFRKTFDMTRYEYLLLACFCYCFTSNFVNNATMTDFYTKIFLAIKSVELTIFFGKCLNQARNMKVVFHSFRRLITFDILLAFMYFF